MICTRETNLKAFITVVIVLLAMGTFKRFGHSLDMMALHNALVMVDAFVAVVLAKLLWIRPSLLRDEPEEA
jgi:hypothetical protein